MYKRIRDHAAQLKIEVVWDDIYVASYAQLVFMDVWMQLRLGDRK